MHPAERIAKDTWGRMKQARDLRVRLGEETLTDLLVLDFVRLMKSRARLFQSTKKQESKRGTDLEIRIHAGGNRAIAFALQAKKLYRDEKYNGLKATVKSSNSFQLDILENYAETVRATPLYLLYNYVCREDIQPYWNCCGYPDEGQLGCTVVPSWIIRRAIEKKRGRRNFDWIHKSNFALPWRCLFDCPHGCRLDYDWVHCEPVDGGWPEWLWSQDDGKFSDEDVERLRQEILRRESLGRDLANFKDEETSAPNVLVGDVPGYLILLKEKAA